MNTLAFSGVLIYSHILTAIIAFFAIILIANGIMDRKMLYAIGGVALFFFAGILPFIILPFILGV